jgi:hypothetical protein
MNWKLKTAAVAAAMVMGTAGVAIAQQKSLDTIKARGSISCGVSPGLPGFSNPDGKGAGRHRPTCARSRLRCWRRQEGLVQAVDG